MILQGRPFGAEALAQVRQLLIEHPDWSRYRLSRHLAELWQWRNARGQLKDMAARTLLLKLEQRGWIQLPPRRLASPNRMRHKQMPILDLPAAPAPLDEPLAHLQPLRWLEVSSPGSPGPRPLFEALLHRYHYLSYRSPVGENLQYLVQDRLGRPVACLLFSAAAWQCAARDRFIGWSDASRQRHLGLLTNNTRFLVLPWVRVPHLASHVLARVCRQVSRDWCRKYGHPVYLLETFVERPRFAGTAYRAANWRWVGQTQGRSRQDRADGTHHQLPRKDVFVYPLHRDFRTRLQGELPCPSEPTPL